MALVRNAANTLRKGRIGETTYYASKGRQIARQALNNSNYGESARRSLAQQRRRVKWANLVNFYKLCSGWMPKAFESKKPGQTDYNKFMQLNVNAQRVALTRDQAINGGCVADAFAITQGTLGTMTGARVATGVATNISTTISGSDWGSVTVQSFSQDLIAQNSFIREGMQLSVVMVEDLPETNGVPRVSVTFCEVIIDSTNTEPLKNYIPEAYLDSDNNKLLVYMDAQSARAAAVILSELTDTGLKVSSETLVGDFTRAAEYATDAKVAEAIETYGLDKEVILNPDSAEPIV